MTFKIGTDKVFQGILAPLTTKLTEYVPVLAT